MKQRINEEISASQVQLLLTVEKKRIILSTNEAIKMANDAGGDLVEVNSEETPPLCKIIIQKKTYPPVTIEELPEPLRLALQQMEKETQPFRKVHRLIDAIEVFIKIHTVIALSRFFDHKNIPADLRTLLYRGLKTPSLGIWWSFAREFIKIDSLPAHSEYAEIFRGNLSSGGIIFKQLESTDNLIAFRNGYAHGATPPDEQCKKDIMKYQPALMKMIERCYYFRFMKLITADQNGNLIDETEAVTVNAKDVSVTPRHLYLEFTGELIDLHPLLVFRQKSKKYFFYNDLRKTEINLLNYDSFLRERDAGLKDEFLVRYPIEEEDTESDKFKDLIESLTETFKGRQKELKEIVDFLGNYQSGFLFIWGSPGVGKSALLARAVQLFGWASEIRIQAGFDNAIFYGNLYVIEYLIRRDMKSNNTEDLLNYLLIRLSRHFKISYQAGRSIKEQEKALEQMLDAVSAKMSENERLVVVIDGLDEAVEVPDLLSVLPKKSREKILIIYSSRPNPVVEHKVYDDLSRENRKSMTLGGLSVEDTRAFLYEYVDKYQLKNEYIETLVEKSEGNPLFIKLICLGLERNEYTLNDTLAIPEGIAEIYEKTMRRYSEYRYANDFLRLLAVSKDFLSAETAEEIMKVRYPEITIDSLKAEAIFNCEELLIEEKSGQKSFNYQLFHESLREFIRANKDYTKNLRQWNQAVISWASNWRTLTGESKTYALKYLMMHLKEEYYSSLQEDEANARKILQDMISTIETEEFRKTAFLKIGNDYYLKIALMDIQQILKTIDKQGEHMERFLHYAVLLHTITDDYYEEQRNNILSESGNNDFDMLVDYARMGTTAKDKIMLVLLGIWNSDTAPVLNNEIKHQLNEWLKDVHDPSLEKLVAMSVE